MVYYVDVIYILFDNKKNLTVCVYGFEGKCRGKRKIEDVGWIQICGGGWGEECKGEGGWREGGGRERKGRRSR